MFSNNWRYNGIYSLFLCFFSCIICCGSGVSVVVVSGVSGGCGSGWGYCCVSCCVILGSIIWISSLIYPVSVSMSGIIIVMNLLVVRVVLYGPVNTLKLILGIP